MLFKETVDVCDPIAVVERSEACPVVERIVPDEACREEWDQHYVRYEGRRDDRYWLDIYDRVYLCIGRAVVAAECVDHLGNATVATLLFCVSIMSCVGCCNEKACILPSGGITSTLSTLNVVC